MAQSPESYGGGGEAPAFRTLKLSPEERRSRAAGRLLAVSQLVSEVSGMKPVERQVPLLMMRKVLFAAYREAIAAGVDRDLASGLLDASRGGFAPQTPVKEEYNTEPQMTRPGEEAVPAKKTNLAEQVRELNTFKQKPSSETSPQKNNSGIASCIICHFETEMDDAIAQTANGRCVCLRCFNRETGRTRPMDNRLRRDIVSTLNDMDISL